MSYSPDLPNTQHICLPRELIELKETLAENVHEMWARHRIAEGWVYGPQRDDQAQTHPCLVPYDKLPESEKEYDRETAVDTLRAVLAHGYRILPPSDAAAVTKSNEVDRDLESLRELLLTVSLTNLSLLIARWRMMSADCRWVDRQLSCRLVERLLEFGEPLLAYDLTSEGLTHWPGDRRLMQLKGMSLSRAGAAREANHVFRQLRDAGHSDEETLGNLARTYKTLWSDVQDPSEKRRYLDAAFEAYSMSYQATKGYWSGINVAFLALMRDDRATAIEVATDVYEQCLGELDGAQSPGVDTYWLAATLGEASLVRGTTSEALSWYKKATDIAGKRYGNIATTCRQARVLVEHLDLDWSPFADCFTLPQVVIFFSPSPVPLKPESEVTDPLQATIAQAICSELTARRPTFGLSCLRNWWDLIFVETILGMGGDVAVLLEDEQVVTTWEKQTGYGRAFAQRAQTVISKCLETHHLTSRSGTAVPRDDNYASRILLGLGNMHAHQLGTEEAVVLALPQSPESPQARENTLVWKPTVEGGVRVLPIRLDHDAARQRQDGESRREDDRTPPTPDGILGTRPRVMALLFADVKGFSRLHEKQLVVFMREFLGMVSSLVHKSLAKPVTRHTWGDGLFLTFERIADAGRFALELAELIDATDWKKLELPEDLNLRIGLHAGPVYECFDPVSEQKTFCGIHVNHAARIEPITPPGNVYASEAFAALASEEGIDEFVCEYVGRTPLAKNFGLFSTYHVRRIGQQRNYSVE